MNCYRTAKTGTCLMHTKPVTATSMEKEVFVVYSKEPGKPLLNSRASGGVRSKGSYRLKLS